MANKNQVNTPSWRIVIDYEQDSFDRDIFEQTQESMSDDSYKRLHKKIELTQKFDFGKSMNYVRIKNSLIRLKTSLNDMNLDDMDDLEFLLDLLMGKRRLKRTYLFGVLLKKYDYYRYLIDDVLTDDYQPNSKRFKSNDCHYI